MAFTTAKKIPKAKELAVFVWQGVNRKGKKISGELSAANPIELKAQLRKQGITPSKVKRKPKPLFGMSGEKKIHGYCHHNPSNSHDAQCWCTFGTNHRNDQQRP